MITFRVRKNGKERSGVVDGTKITVNDVLNGVLPEEKKPNRRPFAEMTDKEKIAAIADEIGIT